MAVAANAAVKSEYAFLVVDHVNGDGHEDRKRFCNSQAFYSYLHKRRRMARYQILCHNCNSAKAFHGGCPHAKMSAPIPVVVTYTGKIEMPAPFISMPAQPGVSLRLN